MEMESMLNSTLSEAVRPLRFIPTPNNSSSHLELMEVMESTRIEELPLNGFNTVDEESGFQASNDVESTMIHSRNVQKVQPMYHQYRAKSSKTLVKLIENRDREIADLKSYIDGLLLRVINSCPTLLQTSVNRDTVASPHAQFKKISK